MVPTGGASAILFLAFVAPGLVFQLRSERRFARAEESTFREISRVVLASVLFSGTALLLYLLGHVAGLSRWPQGGVFVDFDKWIAEPADYFEDHYVRVLFGIALQCGVACAIALVTQSVLHRKEPARLVAISPLTKIFRRDAPPGCYPLARLKLKSGTVYVGRVSDFSSALSPDARDVVLSPPIQAQSPSGTLRPVPSGWQRLWIPGTEIESVTVQYVSTDSGTSPLPDS